MTHTEKYIKSFGNNLTEIQIKIIKDTYGYQGAMLADAWEDFMEELGIFRNIKSSQTIK